METNELLVNEKFADYQNYGDKEYFDKLDNEVCECIIEDLELNGIESWADLDFHDCDNMIIDNDTVKDFIEELQETNGNFTYGIQFDETVMINWELLKDINGFYIQYSIKEI